MSGMNLSVGIENIARGTNVIDLVVPAKLREKHSTGIDWWDDALGGKGFTPGTMTMLTGTPGGGKTTGLLQLSDSLTGQGHTVLYNSGEESLYQVKLVAERLRLKRGFIIGQDTLISDAISHTEHLMSKMKNGLDKEGRLKVGGKQVFLMVDSLQCMDDGKYGNGTNGMTPVRVIEALTEFAKRTFVNVVFIGQVTKGGVFAGKNTILHAVDTHAHLYIETDKRSEWVGERMFTIPKNRYGCSGRTYMIGMSETGLTLKGSFQGGAFPSV